MLSSKVKVNVVVVGKISAIILIRCNCDAK